MATRAEIPLAQNLGLADLLKRTYKEMRDDHLGGFASLAPQLTRRASQMLLVRVCVLDTQGTTTA